MTEKTWRPGAGSPPGAGAGREGSRALPRVLRERHLAQPFLPPPRGVEMPGSSPLSGAQRPVSVEPLEEAFAKLISADHDGTGGSSLDDPGQEACEEAPGA